MSTTPKHDKYPGGDSPGGKSRGNRLARRARSFKEDFLGILSQMRSPGGTGTRSGSRAASPSSPRAHGVEVERPPSAEMDANVRQAQLALKHFRDVVDKDKLEMLPGNGTIVLETVTAIHVLLKKYLINEQSSTLVSASNQVYQSLAKLIRFCDDYLLLEDKALVRESVSDVLKPVEDAIQNLVALSKDKLGMRDVHSSDQKLPVSKPRTLSDRQPLDASQRSSLPDISLTPREREILEQTSAFVLDRHSHSSENVLRDSPPPKPPHPDRIPVGGFPPPLPPKKRQKQFEDNMGVLKTSLENLSLRSNSPGNCSMLSASGGSLDSVLNHSREEELRNLLDDSLNPAYLNGSSHSCYHWDSSSSTSTEMRATDNVLTLDNSRGYKQDRFSGSQAESGIASMPSRRSSSQSYSTCSQQLSSARSSQISHSSQESHHTERKISKEATNMIHYQHCNSVVDSSSSSSTNSVRMVTNDSTISKQTTKLSYSAQTFMESACACAPEPWVDGDIVSYCPTHKPKSSPSNLVPSSIDNPTDHGWSLLSSPSQEDDSPPALPEKTRQRVIRRERHPSQYDNVPEGSSSIVSVSSSSSSQHQAVFTRTVSPGGDVDTLCEAATMEASRLQEMTLINSEQGVFGNSVESKNLSFTHLKTEGGVMGEEEVVLRSALSSLHNTSDGQPPPLPLKKKHIMAYMEMFGNASHANTSEFMRHSVHVYQQQQQQQHQHNLTLSSTKSCTSNLHMHSIRVAHQSLDPRTLRVGLPPALPPKRSRLSSTRSSTTSPPNTPTHTTDPSGAALRLEVELSVPESPPLPADSPSAVVADPACSAILGQIDISQYLVFRKSEDEGEGPDIRGGHPDALLIHATKAQKNDFLYQEAFLTTYRTFMSPLQLIEKLCGRYDSLSSTQDSLKQRAARESFSLLVRVVSDLTLADADTVILKTLMEFVQALLCKGDLTMAKALRVVMLSKYEAKKLQTGACSLPSHSVTIRQSSLLEFKSEHVAEQMTHLDAELFLKIEIPEVLIWAQEQNEERSPNLTRFTEHFNKMSYWARSRILEQNDARERERYVIKFIKIMKHLRKMNNFNSYLALLSALDSAPIRRLEWPKHITEGLKEYCALIDSSSSFRAYRQALAETHPPCIPYIGLVLQDLTFVHIGNSDLLPDGSINFSKRWQQFNIVENMKRFKKGIYPHRKHERIVAFFNGFDESLSEEAMWQISEKIKPRGGKKL